MALLHCSSPNALINSDACHDGFACRKRCLSSTSCKSTSEHSAGTLASFEDCAATTPFAKPQQKRSRCAMEVSPCSSEMDSLSIDTELPMGGWFSKCRGCGWMTSHDYDVQTTVVPCCKRCQETFDHLPGDKKDRMLQGLLYVHTAWTNAGL